MDAIFSKGTDFFLMQGDFGKLCPLWAFGFALTAASAARAGNAKANIFKGTALTALGQYGGWMIVSLLLGSRSALFDNENYILFSALAWLATGRSEVNDALSSFPAQIYLNVADTMMRAHIMIKCYDAGAAAGGEASNFYPHAFVVAVACGITGGLGGAFGAFGSNGINSMDSWGDNWDSKSVLLFNGWRALLADPTGGKLAGALFGANNNAGFQAASAIAFLVIAPIIVSFAPDLPNPLGVEASLDVSGGGGGGKKRSSSPKRK